METLLSCVLILSSSFLASLEEENKHESKAASLFKNCLTASLFKNCLTASLFKKGLSENDVTFGFENLIL